MSRLYRHLRVHQIFGANTSVGKTVLTTALCQVSARAHKRVFYLKPVSTGPTKEADDKHVEQYSGRFRDWVQTACLFRYDEPVSPHLAARAQSNLRNETRTFPSDEDLVNSVANYIDKCARIKQNAVLYIETAGGPHSPVVSGNTQADAYRPLFLPIILVGDPRLGGISSTISAYESLLLRGYRVDGIIMFRDSYYLNFEYLDRYFTERNVAFASLLPPPGVNEDMERNRHSTEQYYVEITQRKGGLEDFEDLMNKTHLQRLVDLQSIPGRTLATVWWPFVQHGMVKRQADVNVIDSALGDNFSVYRDNTRSDSDNASLSLLSSMYDGSASWWTQVLGHGNTSLSLAAAKAAGRYGHVIFPQSSHAPALRLAERLVREGPGVGWASRAYFSDDGSTGMEVALKMALRAFAKRTAWIKNAGSELGVIGIKGSYHGDTIGAMDASEEGIFTCEWHNAKGYWFDPPTVGISAGQIAVNLPPCLSSGPNSTFWFPSLPSLYDVEARLHSPLALRYRDFISRTLSSLRRPGKPELSAAVLEPLVMGAGGMVFVDPLFQRVLVDVVRTELNSQYVTAKGDWRGLPVIFDEVFVGLYRLGMESCSSVLGIKPDVAVYAKNLTGGLVPMAVTLASDSIFRAFKGETKGEALLHGHSYTAYPVGCEVANETLDILGKLSGGQEWSVHKRKWRNSDSPDSASPIWSFWDPAFVNALSMKPSIAEVMTLGTVLAFKIHDTAGGYISSSAHAALAFLEGASIPGGPSGPFGVHFRTLGDVAYLMCSLNTSSKTLRALEQHILEGFSPGSD